MLSDFTPAPHQEAIDIIKGKPVVSSRVFDALLPEIRTRVFSISGIESTKVMQAVRDEIALVPAGQTWAKCVKNIAVTLAPSLGDGAKDQADLLLRVNVYQAFAAANHRAIMESPNITHCQYVHGNAEVPTPEHLALDGIIPPKDDKFWDDHTGPWGHPCCVCTKIGLFEDTVASEKAADEQRAPDQRLVLTGSVAQHLRDGDLVRNGRRYFVGAQGDSFKWHPDNFRVSLQELEARYNREVWNRFRDTAQGTIVENGLSLWEWLGG